MQDKQAILEYARQHGLARDHRQCDPFDILSNITHLGLDTFPGPSDDRQADDSEVFNDLFQHRLSINRKGLDFLQSIINPKQPSLDDYVPSRRPQHLSIDLPLLKSNHYHDLESFTTASKVDLSLEDCLLVPPDSPKTRVELLQPDLGHGSTSTSTSDKLDVPRESVLFSKSLIDSVNDDTVVDRFFESEFPLLQHHREETPLVSLLRQPQKTPAHTSLENHDLTPDEQRLLDEYITAQQDSSSHCGANQRVLEEHDSLRCENVVPASNLNTSQPASLYSLHDGDETFIDPSNRTLAHDAAQPLKLHVPDLDSSFHNTRPTSEQTSLQKLQETQSIMLPFSKMGLHHWPGVQAAASSLNWNPNLEDANREDSPPAHNPAVLQDIIALKPPQDLDAQSGKISDAAILDRLEVNNEPLKPLLSLQEQQPEDLSSLVRIRKRKMNLEASQGDYPETQEFTGLPSTFDQMRQYMELQGKPYSKPRKPQLEALQSSLQPPPKQTSTQPQLAKQVNPHPPPPLNNPDAEYTIIINTSLMTNRPLIKSLISHLPNLNLIEREYDPVSPEEADIITSPSTGLIFTSLTRARQRAEPPSHLNSLQQHVSKTAARYQRLLVLVCPALPRPDDAYPELDPRDQHALQTLRSACSPDLASEEVQVHYIPATSWPQAGRWLASYVTSTAQNPSQTEDPAATAPVILQDETTWERVLRAAGLNAFAAQAVLYALKHHLHSQPTTSSAGAQHDQWRLQADGDNERRAVEADGSLARLLCMTAERRLQLFGGVCGGRKGLDALSRVVEARWEPQDIWKED